MPPQNDYQRLLQTVRGQLESEQLLGGRWLPIGTINIKQKPSQSETSTAGNMAAKKTIKVSKQDKALIEEKSRQLAQLAQEIAKCTQCSLHETRIKVVPGEGNPNARIVFVGEAPGQSEDQQGRPFVGRAGKLLDNIIQAMGFDRRDVFICNILKCRPPKNRDPQADEIQACIGFLYRQLEIIAPEIIIALGAHAAKTLLDTNTPIGQLRGKVHEYSPGPQAQPIKLVATYHPAYLLRNYTPDARLKVWQDMKIVLSELGLPIPKKKK